MGKKNLSMKLVVLLLAVVLLIGCTAGGTLAWLMTRSETITNTFTAGNIQITLTEDKPDNRTAKLVPGTDIVKNPTVTVLANSEACWLFVKVTETNTADYLKYEMAADWTLVETGTGYKVYGRAVAAGTADQPFTILKDNKVSVPSTVTKAQMDALTVQPELSFTAYAIQSANLKNGSDDVTTAADAWAVYSVNP